MTQPLPPRAMPAPFVATTDGSWQRVVAPDLYLVDYDHVGEESSRSEIGQAAERHGLRVIDLLQAVYRIAGALDRREWNADTLDTVADIVRPLGFPVRDVEEVDETT